MVTVFNNFNPSILMHSIIALIEMINFFLKPPDLLDKTTLLREDMLKLTIESIYECFEEEKVPFIFTFIMTVLYQFILEVEGKTLTERDKIDLKQIKLWLIVLYNLN